MKRNPEILVTTFNDFESIIESRLQMVGEGFAARTNNFYNLYRSTENAIKKFNLKGVTNLIIGVANPLCNFEENPKNILGDAKPVIFYKVIDGNLEEFDFTEKKRKSFFSKSKMNDEYNVVIYQAANLYPEGLFYQIEKHGCGESHLRILQIIDSSFSGLKGNIPQAYLE